ncbi:MAG: 3-methyl-2-oxobutanoate hydroxymethyltransferase [Endozoicomonadaceae bacterium]|nr:3-methyl-2-oxobutanoate hydroxymethyltransferase [Endozoicomonadaceae bacterium]
MTSITTTTVQQMKNHQKITCLTAYDATQSFLASSQGIDVLLVGDSAGMVIQGHNSTLPVTLSQMVYHTECVKTRNQGSLLIADMPFMSYYTTEKALNNAAKLMQAGAQMVKLECGFWAIDTIKALTEQGIPTCAHIGFTPQSIALWGKPKIFGKSKQESMQLTTLACELESAGAHLILLECIPSDITQSITKSLSIPTIGIGAGPHADGQILVFYDMIGATTGQTPRFVKNFMTQTSPSIQEAIAAYVHSVKSNEYPAAEHCYSSI